MCLSYSKILRIACVGFLIFSSPNVRSEVSKRGDPKILTILHDFSPPTLNPRFTTEATGQRLGMLLFSALTKLNSDLTPVPDLAESWSVDKTGTQWRFKIKSGIQDWEKKSITTEELRSCLEEYLSGTPTSPLKGSFQSLKAFRAEGSTLVFDLYSPDPYLPRNLVLLKFFRVKGEPKPCAQPKANQEIVGSGPYQATPFNLNPESEITLKPVFDEKSPALRFIFIKDETTRVLKIMGDQIDVAQNTLSQTKVSWVLKKNPNFRVLERDGVNVSYLAFNLKNPYLSDVRVRRAIAHSIDRETIMREKLKGFVSRAGSFLSPYLPESYQSDLEYNPALSEKILDESGFQKKENGYRFTLHYKTTPSREGIEMAQIFKSMFAKVGIELKLDIVDLGVFLSSTKKGMFDIYNSRWIGVADGSIFYRTLHSKSGDNRVKYSNSDIDAWIDQATHAVDVETRKKNLILVQKAMGTDVPYFPLWFWTNALLLRKDVIGLDPKDLSLSGGYQPLMQLRRIEE